MAALTNLVVAMAAFVGTHFLLSHPLRRPLVRRLGDGRFLGLYSLVALATFAWMVLAARAAAPTAPRWVAPAGVWTAAAVVMLFACILFAGSLVANPAAPDPAGARRPPAEARGVYAITRHPMMWSFALWAAVHAALWGSPVNLVITGGIAILALGGAAAQDVKKARLLGEGWRAWEARTAYWPFAAQLGGRAGWSATLPHLPVVAGGVALWLAASAAHPWLGAPQVGLWRWLG